MRWKNESGQAATESMLVIAVVTIAVVASGYSFVPMFGNGVNALAQDVAEILEVGDIGDNGGGAGNNTGDARRGEGVPGLGSEASSESAATAQQAGNDTSSIPNMTGQPDPRYVPSNLPQLNSAGDPMPGNDTDPVGTDRDGAFPANRGSLGSAAPLANTMGRTFGAGPGL